MRTANKEIFAHSGYLGPCDTINCRNGVEVFAGLVDKNITYTVGCARCLSVYKPELSISKAVDNYIEGVRI